MNYFGLLLVPVWIWIMIYGHSPGQKIQFDRCLLWGHKTHLWECLGLQQDLATKDQTHLRGNY